jgi:hypothetical protein
MKECFFAGAFYDKKQVKNINIYKLIQENIFLDFLFPIPVNFVLWLPLILVNIKTRNLLHFYEENPKKLITYLNQ